MRRLFVTLVAASFLIVPTSVWAFCGFYVSGADASLFNDATMVVMMRDGTRTVLSMQNTYEGPPEDFAMVIPVPQILQEDNVQTLPNEVFADVDQMAAPRLVEYWEQDPCNPHQWDVRTRAFGGAVPTMDMLEGGGGPGTVVVEAQFEVGEYEIVILSSDDATALDTWLRSNDYRIPDGAEALFRPYIEAGQYFFVARVNVEEVTFEEGRAVLSPLRFHYDTDTFALPIRLGLINAGQAQDLIVHILARNQRYEVANYENVTIPTNIGITDVAMDRFGEFYAALFDRTMEVNPGAVVTEYSWAANTCDPCPGATLNSEDFLTLGADTLPGQPTGGWVLTRLHTRYTADTAGEDLVFRAAAPIVGGREVHNADGELEHGSSSSSVNNFQGRYIVRHPWEGEVACDNPEYGVWGGPPGQGSDDPTVSAGESDPFVERGSVELAELITTAIPEIQITPALGGGGDGGDDLEFFPDAPPSGFLSCTAAPSAPRGFPWIAAGLAALVLRRRSFRG